VPTITSPYPGMSLEVFDYIMRVTGMPYMTVSTNVTTYGTRTNSTTHPWTGYLGDIYANRYDTIPADLYLHLRTANIF
jgi:hypothetical protein